MTKKKALIYTVIFLVLVCSVQLWKTFYLTDPAQKFNDMCKNVLAPSCQVYINQITSEKKFDEKIAIQKERIRVNKQVLGVYKRKISNKSLLKMTAQEADKTLMACAKEENCKKDYFILHTAQLTIQDIVLDSFNVANVQYNELKDADSAVKTLLEAQKVLVQNEYMPARDSANDYIDKQISEFLK